MSDREEKYNLAELAENVGLTRRTVRFYIHSGLLAPPGGKGRGRHYNQDHVLQLKEISRLQSLGHSLESIGKILKGELLEHEIKLSNGSSKTSRIRMNRKASIWSRWILSNGVELHWNPSISNISEKQFQKLLEALDDVIRNEE